MDINRHSTLSILLVNRYIIRIKSKVFALHYDLAYNKEMRRNNLFPRYKCNMKACKTKELIIQVFN